MKTVKPNRRHAKKGTKPARKNAQDAPTIKDLLLNGPKFDLIIQNARDGGVVCL